MCKLDDVIKCFLSIEYLYKSFVIYGAGDWLSFLFYLIPNLRKLDLNEKDHVYFTLCLLFILQPTLNYMH